MSFPRDDFFRRFSFASDSRFFVLNFVRRRPCSIIAFRCLAGGGPPGGGACCASCLPYVGVWIAAPSCSRPLLAAAVRSRLDHSQSHVGVFVPVWKGEAASHRPRWLSVMPRVFRRYRCHRRPSLELAMGPELEHRLTPLTLCLVCGGQSRRCACWTSCSADNQPVTMPKRFSIACAVGDADEISAGARTYLTSSSFAAYCDRVLVLPAAFSGVFGLHDRAIHRRSENEGAARTSWQIIEAIAREGRKAQVRRHARGAVLENPNAGLLLRFAREQLVV